MNLRHVHMKQKYGVDVQFPLGRYVNGLTSSLVPNRDGEYPSGKAVYVGTNNCTNPLFAAALPDGSDLGFDPTNGALCKLPLGSRTPDMIFYAHIGGVPNSLLHFKAGDARATALSDPDWQKILGRDPDHFDYTNIDPHMIESYAPRAGLPGPSSANDADPISGREWVTNATTSFVDLQYACTFPLAAARDCSLPSNQDTCDCPSAPGVPHDQTSPVCDAANTTSQTRAKAYPTIRETTLAKLMGDQAVLASICPTETANTASPLFGYRPAMTALVDRMASTLSAASCLPQGLPQDGSGAVACAIVEALPSSAKCDPALGLSAASAGAASAIRKAQPALPPDAAICEVAQLGASDLVNGSCEGSSKPGWCYVTGAAAGTCAQRIVFSPTSTPVPGASLVLSCAPASCTH